MYSVFDPAGNFQAVRELASLLTRHRHLTWEMAKREITDRYVGQILGAFWAIGHPLILILVYAFVFGFVFKVKIGSTPDMPLDYTTYMLAGLIPWLSFLDSISKSTVAIVSNANLVKQVVFPIEILPIKGVLSSLLTEGIFLGLLAAYVLVTKHFLPWTYLLIPVLLLLQALAMIGMSYFLSAIGAFLRDLKDLVQVFSVAGVYLIPAFYLPSFVPGIFRRLLYINPFSHLIWCFQDALYFGRFAHPWAWAVMSALSIVVFAAGYRFFRRIKTVFGNLL